MLSAISLSDKLISLMLQELLSRTMGTCDEGTAGAQCPLAWAEQVTQLWDTPGQGKGSKERGNWGSERGKTKMLLWISSSGLSDLENTRGSRGQDESRGTEVIIFLLPLEMTLYPPAVALPVVGWLDIIPAPCISVPSILSVQP